MGRQVGLRIKDGVTNLLIFITTTSLKETKADL